MDRRGLVGRGMLTGREREVECIRFDGLVEKQRQALRAEVWMDG